MAQQEKTKANAKPSKKALRYDTSNIVLRYTPVVAPPGKETLSEDLEKYRQIALEMGAEEAVIVPTSEIPIELRVYYKCMFPRCYCEGTNVQCPPRWKTPWKHAKMILNSFNYAIIFRTIRKPENFLGPVHLVPEHTMPYTKYAPVEELLDARGFPRKSIVSKEEGLKPNADGVISVGGASISARLEKEARRDGHHFAMAFGAGSCIMARCSKFGGRCQALKSGICRFAGSVRPEGSAALYINYYALQAKMGWQQWIGAHSVFPEDIPHDDPAAYGTGLVLID
jgi:predicted metal-binding protein